MVLVPSSPTESLLPFPTKRATPFIGNPPEGAELPKKRRRFSLAAAAIVSPSFFFAKNSCKGDLSSWERVGFERWSVFEGGFLFVFSNHW